MAAKKDFLTLKVETDKLNINESIKVSTGLNDLETKADDLHVGKLKTAPKDLEKSSDEINKEVVKKPVCNTLNMKVNNLENEIPDDSSLIQTNLITQINKIWRKKLEISRSKFLTVLV